MGLPAERSVFKAIFTLCSMFWFCFLLFWNVESPTGTFLKKGWKISIKCRKRSEDVPGGCQGSLDCIFKALCLCPCGQPRRLFRGNDGSSGADTRGPS